MKYKYFGLVSLFFLFSCNENNSRQSQDKRYDMIIEHKIAIQNILKELEPKPDISTPDGAIKGYWSLYKFAHTPLDSNLIIKWRNSFYYLDYLTKDAKNKIVNVIPKRNIPIVENNQITKVVLETETRSIAYTLEYGISLTLDPVSNTYSKKQLYSYKCKL